MLYCLHEITQLDGSMTEMMKNMNKQNSEYNNNNVAFLTGLSIPGSDTAIAVPRHNDDVMRHNTTISHRRRRPTLRYRTRYATKLHRVDKRSDVDRQHVVIQHAGASTHGAEQRHHNVISNCTITES